MPIDTSCRCDGTRLCATCHGPGEEPRTYVVGLPVVITVHPDGTVTAEVDLSEADDIFDASTPEEQDDSEEVLIADKETISDAVEQDRVTVK